MNNTITSRKRQIIFAFVVFLTTVNLSLSQSNKECENRIQTEFISKIEGYKPTDLVPYYDAINKKWGFIYKKNKEILVEAVFTNLQTFKPYLRDYSKIYGNCVLSLKYSTNGYSFFTLNEQIMPPMPVSTYNATKFVKNIEGFEVNEKGKIEAVNSKFFTPKDTFSNLGYLKINQVFKYRDTYYGVVRNENNGFSIYNDQGVIIDGFQNLKSFPNIGNNYDDCNDLWILAKFDSDEYIFKSITTQDTFQINCSSPSCWDCAGRNLFGYQILKVNDEIGLFDMITMKWKIKPDAKNKFHSIYYSTNIEIENGTSQKQVIQNRKMSEIYLLTYENIIIDLNGKAILPKKNKEDH